MVSAQEGIDSHALKLNRPETEAAQVARTQFVRNSSGEMLAELQVLDDLKFWVRRIYVAAREGKRSTNNRWSLRGEPNDYYVEALRKRFHRCSFYLEDSGIITVSW